MTEPVRLGLDDFNDVYYDGPLDDSSPNGQPELAVVPLDQFADTEEAGATPLVGEEDDILIPENGDIMFYGDGGAGKTTLAIHLAFCAATATEWLDIPIPRRLTVLLIENEGPRPLFRQKLRRKRDGWDGPNAGDRLLVLETPWAELRLDQEVARQRLAAIVQELEVDLAIIGPLTRSGMNEAGTLQEVRDFMQLVAEVRTLAGRHLTIALIHHENKGGQVSGAWEGAGDTLFHVQGQGHGKTRLYIQKARWASKRHGTTLQLAWTEGDGFDLEDKPERDDNTIADLLLQAVLDYPGAGWNIIRKQIGSGARAANIQTVRDRLLTGGQILNAGSGRKGAPMQLWHVDDPARPEVIPAGETPGKQSDAPSSGGHASGGVSGDSRLIGESPEGNTSGRPPERPTDREFLS